MSMSMQMTFYNSHSVTLFFESWDISSAGYYWLALIGLFASGIVLELLFLLQSKLMSYHRETKYKSLFDSRKVKVLGLLAAIRFGWLCLSYLLMLGAMTYNTGVFFAIVTGLASGHFIVNFIPKSRLPESVSQEFLSKPCH